MSKRNQLVEIERLLRQGTADYQKQLTEATSRNPASSDGAVFFARRALFLAAGMFEEMQMPHLAGECIRLANDTEALGATVNEEDGDGPVLTGLEPAFQLLHALDHLLPSEPVAAPSPDYAFLVRMAEGLGFARARLGEVVDSEAAYERIAEAVFWTTFADLNSTVALPLTTGYRQPDSDVPSLKTLIEYKFINDVKRRSPLIDEMQADIRNYAGHKRDRLLFCVAQTDDFFTRQALYSDLRREPSTLLAIDVVLTRL